MVRLYVVFQFSLGWILQRRSNVDQSFLLTPSRLEEIEIFVFSPYSMPLN